MPAFAPSELLTRLGSPSSVRLGSAVAASTSMPAAARLHIDALDTVLGGGLPRGRLSEIVGPPSCGKTALLYALLAADTRRGEVVALVDLADAFSPPAASAAGIDLARTLWVRPNSAHDALRCTELLLDASGFGAVAVDLGTISRGTRSGRIGMAAGSRLARAAKRSGAAVILIGPERAAGTFAALGLALRPLRQHWSHPRSHSQSHARHGPVLFDGLDTEIALVRNKLGAPGRTLAIRMTTTP